MFDKSNACDRYIEHNNVRLALKKRGDKKFAANFLFFILYELYIFICRTDLEIKGSPPE